jgi:uroporphyrinogen III methyltransferase/synthase
VTRPASQAGPLLHLLREAGLEAVSVPTVSIAPANDEGIARLGRELDGADWLVVTSANGVPPIVEALAEVPLADSVRVAAVGPATAAALDRSGIRVDTMPSDYLTVAIADVLGDVRGARILLARADSASADLHDALIERGAAVTEVTAYRTVEGPLSSRGALRDALERGLDAVLFTSGSTVRGLLELMPAGLLGRVTCLPAICIGPVTSKAARRAGFAVVAEAAEHTAGGLARATAAYFAPEEP